MRLNQAEQSLLKVIQKGMPLSQTPYRDLAQEAGISVDDLLAALRQWKADGRIRRVGAVINHFRVGSGCGAMGVWAVPEDRVDTVGQLFSGFESVSHVYQRPAQQQWPYSVYTMIHAAGPGELEACIRAMSDKSGITDYRILKTVRELKKVPPAYISQEKRT